MSKYIIQRIECKKVVEEWRTDSPSAAEMIWRSWSEVPTLYPQLIVNSVPLTIGQAEKHSKEAANDKSGKERAAKRLY
nr:MAG TPA: hypothetical protein [Caudoviricetes sp.]